MAREQGSGNRKRGAPHCFGSRTIRYSLAMMLIWIAGQREEKCGRVIQGSSRMAARSGVNPSHLQAHDVLSYVRTIRFDEPTSPCIDLYRKQYRRRLRKIDQR